MPRAYFYTDFCEEFTERIEEYIKNELGYSDEELGNLEVLTWDDLVRDYEEMLEDMLGSDLWEKLGSYIDVEAIIDDDILGGWISEIEVDGQKFYVRER